MARKEVRQVGGRTYTVTKGQRASESQLIPWTPGPKGRLGRAVRALVG